MHRMTSYEAEHSFMHSSNRVYIERIPHGLCFLFIRCGAWCSALKKSGPPRTMYEYREVIWADPLSSMATVTRRMSLLASTNMQPRGSLRRRRPERSGAKTTPASIPGYLGRPRRYQELWESPTTSLYSLESADWLLCREILLLHSKRLY